MTFLKFPLSSKGIDTLAKTINLAKTITQTVGSSESESVLLQKIKKQEDIIFNKNAEICKLREKIEYLEEINHGNET